MLKFKNQTFQDCCLFLSGQSASCPLRKRKTKKQQPRKVCFLNFKTSARISNTFNFLSEHLRYTVYSIWATGHLLYKQVMHQSIPAVPIPSTPCISGAFFLIVRPEGGALVYPWAFDSLVIFTSRYCHFLSVISLSGKDDKFVINFVSRGQNETVDPQN